MNIENREIVVSEGKRPFWQIVIAAFFYTATLFLLFYCFYLLFQMTGDDDVSKVKGASFFLQLAAYVFAAGLSFSVVKTVYVNTTNKKLRTELSVGIIKVNYYSRIPELEYVSVFRNPQTDKYEVNLWCQGNKHYNIFEFDEFKPAFDFGLQYSNKLNIDLLDASERGNFKWIDKSEL